MASFETSIPFPRCYRLVNKTGDQLAIHFDSGPYFDNLAARIGGNTISKSGPLRAGGAPPDSDWYAAEVFATEMALTHFLTDRQRASKIDPKYIHPRTEIMGIDRRHLEQDFRSQILAQGLHIRGTDKFNEAPAVPISLIFSTIHRIGARLRREMEETRGNR